MRKSETGTALPAIRNYHKTTSLYSNKTKHSLFLERVKQQIGESSEYGVMDNTKIT